MFTSANIDTRLNYIQIHDRESLFATLSNSCQFLSILVNSYQFLSILINSCPFLSFSKHFGKCVRSPTTTFPFLGPLTLRYSRLKNLTGKVWCSTMYICRQYQIYDIIKPWNLAVPLFMLTRCTSYK